MNLVTRDGEDILAAYDDWGIRELRRHRLIWRSWGRDSDLRCEDHYPIGPIHGVRQISTDPAMMRLFFLSLLWRAAATSMSEFDEIQLSESDQIRLGKALVTQSPEEADFYPIMLTQLSTRGQDHNMTAVAQEKLVPAFGTRAEFLVPIFRFYFDGLIAHFHRPPLCDPALSLGPLMLGNRKDVVLSTVKFESSWQFENIEIIRAETERNYPGAISRLLDS